MKIVDCTYRHGAKGNAAPAGGIVERDMTFRPTVETFDGFDAEDEIFIDHQFMVSWPDEIWEFVSEEAMKRTGRPKDHRGIPLGEIYGWVDLKVGAVRTSRDRDAYGNPLGNFKRRYWFAFPAHHTPEELIELGCVLVERRSIAVGKPSVPAPMPEPVPARK